MSEFRIIPRFEQMEWCVTFATSPLGKVVMLGLFAFGFSLHEIEWWLDAMVFITAVTFFPRYRWPILAASALLFMLDHRYFNISRLYAAGPSHGVVDGVSWAWCLPLFYLYGFFMLWMAKNGPIVGIRKHPVLFNLVFFFSCVAVAATLPLEGQAWMITWSGLALIGHLIWYLSYSLDDVKSRTAPSPFFHAATWVSAWSLTVLPIAKGSGYLRRIESKDDRAFAICQIKALKLLFWALLLAYISVYFRHVVPGGIPQLTAAIKAAASGSPFPWHLGWASVIVAFIKAMFKFTIWGHVIVAICRMVGFAALRNTWSPLKAKNIADFWNRYMYYFKELLVTFFYYPAYFRFFKNHPRLRLFFAILCAAGFGNALLHVTLNIHEIAVRGAGQALWDFQVYLFYAALLSVGIGLSRLREDRAKPPERGFARSLVSISGILLFFAILQVFDKPFPKVDLIGHLQFLTSLIGVSV